MVAESYMVALRFESSLTTKVNREGGFETHLPEPKGKALRVEAMFITDLQVQEWFG